MARERSKLQSLTAREREVIAFVAAGFTDKEIGLVLGVSAYTSRAHAQSAVRKLGARNRTHATGIWKAEIRRSPEREDLAATLLEQAKRASGQPWEVRWLESLEAYVRVHDELDEHVKRGGDDA